MGSKERLRTLLLEVDDTDESAPMAIGAFRMLPAIVRLGVEKLADQMRGDLPGLPTGKPNSLSQEEKLQAIEFISGLHKSGVAMDIAYGRTAQRFGIGKSTAKSQVRSFL
jgi:hypothetical protein